MQYVKYYVTHYFLQNPINIISYKLLLIAYRCAETRKALYKTTGNKSENYQAAHYRAARVAIEATADTHWLLLIPIKYDRYHLTCLEGQSLYFHNSRRRMSFHIALTPPAWADLEARRYVRRLILKIGCHVRDSLDLPGLILKPGCSMSRLILKPGCSVCRLIQNPGWHVCRLILKPGCCVRDSLGGSAGSLLWAANLVPRVSQGSQHKVGLKARVRRYRQHHWP